MSNLKDSKSMITRRGPAVVAEGDEASSVLDEPLAVSAPLALAAAKRYCHHSPTLGQSCVSYHGTWQYRRIFGLTTGIGGLQRAFFHHVLGSLAVVGSYPRVLITGAADYAMTAIVLGAYGACRADLGLTVMDRCEAPLALNRWYAERLSHPLEVRTCDVLDYEDPRPFDVISTHSFVNQLPPASRPGLIAKWRRLLRPGGKLVIVNRIRPGMKVGPDTAQPERAREFCSQMLRAAESWPDITGVSPQELADLAADFVGRQFYHVTSHENLRRLLADGGFTIERLETSPVEETPQQGVSDYRGPAPPGKGKYYAHIVCTRR
jgi:SAM-dependent methyltransferase